MPEGKENRAGSNSRPCLTVRVVYLVSPFTTVTPLLMRNPQSEFRNPQWNNLPPSEIRAKLGQEWRMSRAWEPGLLMENEERRIGGREWEL